MPLWAAALIGLAVSQTAIMATTIYLHRGLAHRSVKLNPVIAFFFRVVIWATTGIKPRDWAALHRKHHRFEDQEQDPHSPVQRGFWKIQLGNAFLYRKQVKDPTLVPRFAPELRPDRWDRALFDHAWFGLPLGIAAAVWLAGPLGGLVLATTHLVSYILLNAAINAVGHSFGYRRFDGTSARNLRMLALITAGEGLHNNHHGRPASASMVAARSEIDPAWIVLVMLERVRLATLRRPRLALLRADKLPRIPRFAREVAAAAG